MDTVKVMGQDVEIDHKLLEFNEANLSDYMQKAGPLYSFYTQQFYEAQAQLRMCKLEYDKLYGEKFKHYKQGISDKLAEAYVKSDPEVVALDKKVVAADRVMGKLKGYLRSWDMNNDNAIEVARTCRKEMDKLGMDVKLSSDEQIEKMMG